MKTTALFLLIPLFIFGGCQRSDIQTYSGYAEGEFVNLSSTQSGKLDKLFVKRGSHVSINENLFALECDSELLTLKEATADLAAAEAILKDYQKGSRPEEIRVIEAQLSQATASAENAAKEFERNSALSPANAVSKTQLDASETLAKSTAAKVRELKNSLNVAKLAKRLDQISAQEKRVEQLRSAVKLAQWKVNEKGVKSRYDALVFDTLYREGEFVPQGGIIIRLLPPENIKIRFFVPQKISESLHIGDNVSIVSRSDGKKIPAQITYISPEAEFTPPIIYSNETKEKLTYMIEAYPQKSDAVHLHPGQPVEVSLERL
ncbi:secretion protein HlyD family protein [Sulfuricurvum kujiense DSM 16994]|uniref:Secretion protein HlyD family protein n=1 Tax=Sulfuricurvum kujiense (strain ATCC BAA-921 / DSM 16994 / JCM 11577 / YK-1) TaxID=709032 RepID=E4U360_SULKY|nr:HlyD family efflux transporter periplasmic adaptor subunit [Sulfuricurvum kujiense]ADR33730.1 secretion protein HlyD family protein [Sulfuricurvum kujiense DSM 16994]